MARATQLSWATLLQSLLLGVRNIVERWIESVSPERRWLVVVLAIQLVLVVGMLRADGMFDHVGMDFLTSYTAADMVASGDAADLYDTRAQWEHQRPILRADHVSWPDRVMHPYISPPLLAVATLPLLLLSPALAAFTWSSLNALAVAAGVVVLARSLGLNWRVPAAIVAGSLPLFYTLLLGQVEGILFLAMALFIAELRAGRDVRAGLALAVFAIKPPLLLAPMLFLIVTGRRRAAWTTVGTTTVQAFASLALVGPSGVRDYIDLTRRLSGADGSTVTNVWGMVNVRGIIVRSLPSDEGIVVNLAIAVMTVVALSIAVWVWHRAGDTALSTTGLSLMASTTVLTAYHALYHTALIAMIGVILLVAHALESDDLPRVNRLTVLAWSSFRLVPLVPFLVVQSSKVPALLTTFGILLVWGLAAQSLVQPLAAEDAEVLPSNPEPAVAAATAGVLT